MTTRPATDLNSGPGWYEVIHPRNTTTCIAYVQENGDLYLPEGDDLTPEEFAFAAARGNAHRLVRAADAAAGVQPPTTADPLADCATEYHVPVPEHGGTELLVRRQALAHGPGWAVSTRARGGGRAWTTEGWQDSISALSVDRLFCWPDPATAVDAARHALAAPAAPEEPTPAPQCSAALLPATDEAVDRCVRHGAHDTHATAAGVRWPNDEDPEL
ncbi:hypothetical protein ACH43Y_14195 [Streptomyces rubiginosohelvolus]|uniref:hypothetical protein n=1 Tax=Streptomyces rubiginosohelvolus TaxID=67362 RepID=UPI0037976763